MQVLLLIPMFCLGVAPVACGGDSVFPVQQSTQEGSMPYFGQSPPGKNPVRFAPEIITRELHSAPVFSSGGTEVYWSEMGEGGIQFMEAKDEAWTVPQRAPFDLPYSVDPVFGADENTLFFLSHQQFEGSQAEWDENVWRVVRTAEGWTDPEPLESAINEHPMHWGVSIAENGNLYFGRTGGSDDIYVAEFRQGAYREPIPLGPGVNSDVKESSPHVAPDESYLIFSRGSYGETDLFVSFRSPRGTWETALPLEAVNTGEREASPRMSLDGRYFFFIRRVRGEFRPFWVDSSIVTDLRTP